MTKLSLTLVLSFLVAIIGCKKEESAKEGNEKAARGADKWMAKKADKGMAKKADKGMAKKAGKGMAKKDMHAAIASVTPEDLQKMLVEKKVHCFDANSDATRKEWGAVPGATLLTSYSEYDLSVLPKVKESQLVFYCSNEQCSAAPTAAQRALAAGYKNVATMPKGIMGWKKSGKSTTVIN